MWKKLLIMVLLLTAVSAYTGKAYAAGNADTSIKAAVNYILVNDPAPVHGSSGGDWSVLAVHRSGYAAPEAFFQSYRSSVSAAAASSAVLDQKKYTENSKAVYVSASLGIDPGNISGKNLVTPLTDIAKVTKQGCSGISWALIALNSYRNYHVEDACETVSGKYVNELLSRQLDCGGWDLSGQDKHAEADPDCTAMAVIALWPFAADSNVQTACTQAVAALSGMQLADGGFASYGNETSESTAQVLQALRVLGISDTDGRFVKNGLTIKDALLSMQNADGGFRHLEKEGKSNLISTRQALLALEQPLAAE